ncbi:MAG: hypothetical protein HQL69_01595 [Magnetococcales bacterium]|nr:hypothetical protein [Magnetococcales bacterium]
MTDLLEQAIEKVRLLPANRQDEVAHILLSVVEQDAQDAPRLTNEQVEEVSRRLKDRQYASDEEVTAFFQKYAV